MLSNIELGLNGKKCQYEGVIVRRRSTEPRHGPKRSAERREVNVLVMKCFRSLVGMPRMDRVRNEVVA